MTSVVWFKRDLRVDDHAALVAAAAHGPVVPFYVFEPALLQAEDSDPCHWQFVCECLEELDESLRCLGSRLVVKRGDLPAVFRELRREIPFSRLFSHEETGGKVTYDRDLRVARWCREEGVEWIEVPQHGVVRRLRTRDGWAKQWNQRMIQPLLDVPGRLMVPFELDLVSPIAIPTQSALGLEPSTKTEVQKGGAKEAWSTLESFLTERGVNYRKDMSSPVEGWDGCSRLSPHLAYGSISLRAVYQTCRRRGTELRERKAQGETIERGWLGSLKSFEGRLRWHCHFMQKLEDEPEIEFRNVNRAYDGLREEEWREDRFQAWCRGETGYPMVDACMRALHKTGWVNFRMRAMLVSFSSYHLWLHWRKPAAYLARQFVDFEPGIHYSQFQMQSGVTGINTIRIYSPAKQVLDQDPKGVFLRKYLPALAHVPDQYLAEPHRMPELEQQMAGCVIGKDYPAPIVDHKEAYGTARSRIFQVRARAETKAAAKRVYRKHGSRKRPGERLTEDRGAS